MEEPISSARLRLMLRIKGTTEGGGSPSTKVSKSRTRSTSLATLIKAKNQKKKTPQVGQKNKATRCFLGFTIWPTPTIEEPFYNHESGKKKKTSEFSTQTIVLLVDRLPPSGWKQVESLRDLHKKHEKTLEKYISLERPSGNQKTDEKLSTSQKTTQNKKKNTFHPPGRAIHIVHELRSNPSGTSAAASWVGPP